MCVTLVSMLTIEINLCATHHDYFLHIENIKLKGAISSYLNELVSKTKS